MVAVLPLIAILMPCVCVDNCNTYCLSCHLYNLVSHSVGQTENAADLEGFHIALIYSTGNITQYDLTQPCKLFNTASLSFGSDIFFSICIEDTSSKFIALETSESEIIMTILAA